jgi:hypothetical protein
VVRSDCQRLTINELVRVIHPRQPHPKILAMLEAYLDDSGIHDGATICVIAGYFGRPGAWEKFEIRWRKILASAGVPLEKFHALDLIEHRKFFFGMDRKKHQKLITDLCRAVATFRIYPIAHGVILADFKTLSDPQKRFFTGATIDDNRKPGKLISSGNPDKPYFMPFLHCVRRVIEHTADGSKAHFYFGLDRSFFRYAVEMFKMIKNRPDKPHNAKLGNAHLPQFKETPQLQAADLLCYLTYKHMQDRHAANDWNVMPAEPLHTLLSNMRDLKDLIFFNHETIAESLQTTYEVAGNWDGHAAGNVP